MTGRIASGDRATRASTEPASSLGHTASVPCAFTPGPWSYWHDRCVACESRGEAEFMIDGPPGGYHGQFSKEADARLIAAAPELYDALAAILSEEVLFVWANEGGIGSQEYARRSRIIGDARSAQDKARGEP